MQEALPGCWFEALSNVPQGVGWKGSTFIWLVQFCSFWSRAGVINKKIKTREREHSSKGWSGCQQTSLYKHNQISDTSSIQVPMWFSLIDSNIWFFIQMRTNFSIILIIPLLTAKTEIVAWFCTYHKKSQIKSFLSRASDNHDKVEFLLQDMFL